MEFTFKRSFVLFVLAFIFMINLGDILTTGTTFRNVLVLLMAFAGMVVHGPRLSSEDNTLTIQGNRS